MASGALSMSVVLPGATTYNLTTLGVGDWIDYPTATAVRKSGGGSQIGVAHVGTFTDNVATDSKMTTTWSNGTPTASASSTSLVFSSSGVGIGYSLTFPADTSQRTLTVIAGNYNANVRITATLSDGSAAQVVDNSLTGSSATGKQAVATIVYRAASAGQTLTVAILSTSQGSSSNTSFQAAAMSAPTPVLSADPGAFVSAGNAAGFAVQRKISAQTGAFTLAGAAAGLAAQRKLMGQSGSFALFGGAAAFKVVRTLSASTGGFALTGQVAALTYQPKPSPTGPTYTITTGAGSFILTGRTAAFVVRRQFTAASSVFVLIGRTAALKLTRRLPAATGTFSLQGNAAVLTATSTGGLIDAALVPANRHVLFQSASRMVKFTASERKVRFVNG